MKEELVLVVVVLVFAVGVYSAFPDEGGVLEIRYYQASGNQIKSHILTREPPVGD